MNSSHEETFRVGTSGRVRLRGGRDFDFVCGRHCVVLDNIINSPKKVFFELVEEVLELD